MACRATRSCPGYRQLHFPDRGKVYSGEVRLFFTPSIRAMAARPPKQSSQSIAVSQLNTRGEPKFGGAATKNRAHRKLVT